MRRYGRGRQTSVTDQKRKENALKFYEPHLSAETRRNLEGPGTTTEGAPKASPDAQTMTRVADEMPDVAPWDVAKSPDRTAHVITLPDEVYTIGRHALYDLANEGVTISTDRIASDSVLTHRAPWRPISEITPNYDDTVLIWWPPRGLCLGTYGGTDVWLIVSREGLKSDIGFDQLCADGAVFQSIDPVS